MKDLIQMRGPCGLMMIPVDQKEIYLSKGFVIHSTQPELKPKSVTRKRVRRNRQPLVSKMKVLRGDNSEKN